jgi:hypothetical protein
MKNYIKEKYKNMGFENSKSKQITILKPQITRHDFYLEMLINKLDYVGESKKDIAWIMKDGIWMDNGNTTKNKMPDLVLYYYSDKYSLIELKGSNCKKSKAKKQLDYGEEFLKKFFNAEKIIKKFVIYSKNKYHYEIFN